MHNKWFTIDIENPLKTWWKGRKFFKFPKLQWNFYGLYSSIYFHPTSYIDEIGRVFEVIMWNVQWKDKYNEPRCEKSPFIYLSFLRLFSVKISFEMWYRDELGKKETITDGYWEYMLDFLNYRKKLSMPPSIRYSSKIYYAYDTKGMKPMWMVEPITNVSLTKEGFKKLNSELENEN